MVYALLDYFVQKVILLPTFKSAISKPHIKIHDGLASCGVLFLGMLLPLIIIMIQDHSKCTVNACQVYPVDSVSKMEIVLSAMFLQYIGLHMFNWFIQI